MAQRFLMAAEQGQMCDHCITHLPLFVCRRQHRRGTKGISPAAATSLRYFPGFSNNGNHVALMVGRSDITNRLTALSCEKLVDCLLHPDDTHLYLFDYIAAKTSAASGSRANISFASKFCHYACYYLFEGESAQDNYPIYDSVLRKTLPLYLHYYGLNGYGVDNYASFRQSIDAVISSSTEPISRYGLDHLLWYYFKRFSGFFDWRICKLQDFRQKV